MSAVVNRSEFINDRRPRISVLIPTCNYGRYLSQAIDSVLTQTFEDYELIICDDASTDNSAEVIQRYAGRDRRIRYELHASRLGMVENWNHCLQLARGDYVKFLFGDDLLASNDALRRMSALLDEHPEATLVAAPRLLVDADARITGLWDFVAPGLHDGAEVITRCLRKRSNLIGEPSTVMFRRTLGARGFDPVFRQIVDLEMWFHLLLQGSLAYADEPLCAFRRHESQQTNVNHRSFAPHLEMLQLFDRYIDRPEIRIHLPPSSWTLSRLVFCQRHYARKAAKKHPKFRAALRALDHSLPWHRFFACWIAHRVSRPVENLSRKLRTWSARLARSHRPLTSTELPTPHGQVSISDYRRQSST